MISQQPCGSGDCTLLHVVWEPCEPSSTLRGIHDAISVLITVDLESPSLLWFGAKAVFKYPGVIWLGESHWEESTGSGPVREVLSVTSAYRVIVLFPSLQPRGSVSTPNLNAVRRKVANRSAYSHELMTVKEVVFSSQTVWPMCALQFEARWALNGTLKCVLI